ncbi:MAG: HPF/RaiA family ribosome-associated protein [Chloroflexota bacterium]|nr:HPF/RaiA family ribosome-associated protein [Chloroflexota bacterium]
MHIQINTDGNIEGNEEMAARVSDVVEHALAHVADHITRVEVHLSDENSDKKGGNRDIRCLLEARLEGRHRPIAVTHQAATSEQAVDGASDKLVSSINTILGRQRTEERRSPVAVPARESTGPS